VRVVCELRFIVTGANTTRGKGKTGITIYIDDPILAAFKAESAQKGTGYQTLINEALAQHIGAAEKPMTAEQVRKIVREELAHVR
jgi:BrnA antitoxin of type II toxin-antitoxin system